MNDWKNISTGSGVGRRIRFHEVENVIEEEITQPNMGLILENNQSLMNSRSSKSALLRSGQAWTRVASIPFWLIEHWKNTEGLDFFNPDHRPGLMAKLNSNEYLKLRTARGNLVAHHTEF